jgi:hypothetical protein
LEPKNKELGLAFKTDAKKIKEKLSALTQEEIMEYMTNKNLVLECNEEAIILDEYYFTLTKEQKLELGTNELSTSDNETTVIIDHTYDEGVIELYTKRLLIAGIQEVRKNSNLKQWEKIRIYYKSVGYIEGIFNKFSNEISQELNNPVLYSNEDDFNSNIRAKASFQVHGNDVNIVIVDDK